MSSIEKFGGTPKEVKPQEEPSEYEAQLIAAGIIEAPQVESSPSEEGNSISPEDQVRIEEGRLRSDASFFVGGAEYNANEQLEVTAEQIEKARKEMEGALAGADIVTNPEVRIGRHYPVESALEVVTQRGRSFAQIGLMRKLAQAHNPELDTELKQHEAVLDAEAGEAEAELTIATLRAEIEDLNKMVTTSADMSQLDRFGAKHSFNRAEAHAFIENRVTENEAKIRMLESRASAERARTVREKARTEAMNEMAALANEIEELNGIVSRSEEMTRFGNEHNFNRAEVNAFIENRVAENEAKIKQIAESLKEPRVSPVSNESTPEAAASAVPTEGEAPVLPAENMPTPETPVVPPQEAVPLATPTEGAPVAAEAAPAPIARTEAPVEGNGEKNKKLSPLAAAVMTTAFEKGSQKEEGKESGVEKKSIWGFIKERLKGQSTAGLWEFRQAERFRRGKNEVAADIDAAREHIQKTKHLSLEDALDEAERMRAMADVSGIERPGSAQYEEFSRMITGRKEFANKKHIESIVAKASGGLTERLAKYRNEYGAVVVADEKIMQQFEASLREALLREQDTYVQQDRESYNALIKERLDPKYWKRYVYGGVEAALAAGAAYILLPKLAASGWWAGKKGAEAVLEIAGNYADEIPMKDTIWNTTKEWLGSQGITNPSNQEIMDIAKQVAGDNGIGVKEWGVPGSPMDTGMQQGHLLKFAGAKFKLAALAVKYGVSVL